MTDPRHMQRCQWAEPTLLQPYPYWLVAENYPWTCVVDEVPRPIPDTRACRLCDRQVPRDNSTAD